MTNRIDKVITLFTYIAGELELELFIHDAEVWFAAAPADDTNLHRPFGYTTSDMVSIHCSPDLIVTQTRTLDDTEFQEYLDIVEYHLLKHVQYFHDAEAEVRIDRETYDTWPGSMTVLNAVQMMVLDGACA